MFPVFKKAHKKICVQRTWHPNAQGQPEKQAEAAKLIGDECQKYDVGKFQKELR